MRPSHKFLALFSVAILIAVGAIACGPAAQPVSSPAAGQPGASAPAPGGPTAPAAPAAASIPGPGGEGIPKKGGIYVYTSNDEAPCWDVHCTSRSLLTTYTEKTHNRLLRYDYAGKVGSSVVVGDLADKWEPSTDGKVWTIYLRKGVKFHNVAPVNGRELTADDVKFSWDRIMTGETSIWHGKTQEFIDKVEVVDKYTVRFTLKYAYASFVHRLAEGECCWMVAKEVVSQPNYGKDPKKSMIGTGPFLFDQHQPGVLATMKRNPDYFGLNWPGIPYLDGLEKLIMADAAARLAAFATKQIDITSVPLAELAKVKAIPGVQLRTGAPGGSSGPGISINTTRAPFDNVKVRQALKHGVSQQNVLDGLYKGDGEWSGIMGKEGNFWALPLGEVKQLFRYDPELSKKLLAEAGFPNGLKGEVMIPTPGGTTLSVFEVYKNDLAKAGIDLTVKLESEAVSRKAVEEGNYTLYMSAHTTATEPDEVVVDGFTPNGSRNFSRLNDSIVNDLGKKQSTIVSDVERKKVTDEIQRRLSEVVPLVPMPSQNTYTAAHGYVKNWHPGYDNDDCTEQFMWLEK